MGPPVDDETDARPGADDREQERRGSPEEAGTCVFHRSIVSYLRCREATRDPEEGT
jgi:hypothetical protein